MRASGCEPKWLCEGVEGIEMGLARRGEGESPRGRSPN